MFEDAHIETPSLLKITLLDIGRILNTILYKLLALDINQSITFLIIKLTYLSICFPFFYFVVPTHID